MRAAAVLLLVFGAAFLSRPAAGREVWRSGDVALGFSGSLRTLARFTDGTDADDFARRVLSNPLVCSQAATFANCPAFLEVGEEDVAQNLTRLRLRFDLDLHPKLSAVVTWDNELLFGNLDTFENALGQALADDSFLDLERDVDWLGFSEDDPHRRWRTLLYRAFLQYESDRLEVVVGRQRIAWGVGRLWNPIDRLNSIPPLALQPDQSQGVDAVDVRFLFSGFTYLEAVWAGADPSDDQSWALRLHGVARNVDYSLLFGRFAGALTAGVDLAAIVGDAGLGIEAVYADPSRDVWPVGSLGPSELDPFWQVVVSLEHNFAVGNGLLVLVEYLYNGNALGFGEGLAGPLLPLFESTHIPPDPRLAPLPGPFVRPASSNVLGGSRVLTLARHNTGVLVGYEFVPFLRGDLIVLYDWNGESAVFFPTLRWSPVDSTELSLGVQVPVGKRLSQYGDLEPLVYLMAEWFF